MIPPSSGYKFVMRVRVSLSLPEITHPHGATTQEWIYHQISFYMNVDWKHHIHNGKRLNV
jgi:hypothetical protein